MNGFVLDEYYPYSDTDEHKPRYAFEVRGVGYMQITGREDQLACLRYLKTMGYYQGEIDESALGYVEELRQMPWQAAAWRWAVVDQTKEHSLNAYIVERAKDNGDKLTLGMVLTAESFINGRVSPDNKPEKISENSDENCDTSDATVDAIDSENLSEICSTANDALAAIASGEVLQMIGTEKDNNHWYTVGDYLYVGGWRYRAPNNWTQFMDNYYLLFPEEERWQIQ